MPTYEYRCEKCGNEFELILSMREREEQTGKIACPKCKGKKVVQQLGAFEAKTSRKS